MEKQSAVEKENATTPPTSSPSHDLEKDAIANATLGTATVHLDALEEIDGARIIKPTTIITPEEEKRVVRSLDWHIMPLIFVLYSLSVLDRSNLGNARIAGLETDIGLTSQQYNWLATVFYIACKSH